MQEMCARGELESGAILPSFSIYDGVYLVDTPHILYMSGIAANLFRSTGITPEVREPTTGSAGTLRPRDRGTGLCQRTPVTNCARRKRRRAHLGAHQPFRCGCRSDHLAQLLAGAAVDAFSTHPAEDSRRSMQVLVLLHNATEAVQKERELNVKSAIIQEVHHRVKNNLQNIAAILRIQARRVQSDEARQHLNEAVNRVLSMSVIHEFLSQDEHRPINVKDVCQRIAGQVQQVSGNVEQEIR
jgi:hypothetical protein